MIFYPSIHPNDHHFRMFYKKKKRNCSGDLHPCFHQDIAPDPLGGLQLPPDPQLQLFLAIPCLKIMKILRAASLWSTSML